MALLEVKNLNTYFFTQTGIREAVRDVSFSIKLGETFGLVGESGSGKSVTALSILRLIDEPGRIVSGSIIFDNRPLLALSPGEMRGIRGKDIAMVFQEPLSALNPVMTIGEQITEQILAHKKMGKKEVKARAIELMAEVHLARPGQLFYEYPHRLSGGMRQRAMIAMALSLRPKLLIADEPTTALDVTIQAEILDLFREIKEKHDMSILFITHDFGIVAQLADRVCVMQKGCVVEEGSVDDIFYSPKAEYTKELLAAIPKIPEDMRMR
ncbi:MAG: ABC transporter ATP-binding protein [Candidatus Omnitrophota bacterium]|nr:ABC transporter ATP-binding protein [Candidatus Omnitrophota bacterium]